MWMIIHLGFLLTVGGTFREKITLDAFQKVTPCTTGMRGAIDRVFINGTVTGADSLERDWFDHVIVKSVSKAMKLPLCYVSLLTSDCIYPNRTIHRCYCKDKNLATGEVHFVVNLTAELIISETAINIRRPITSGAEQLLSNNNVTLPKIY
ncbi:unnamed protein product, partial [Candidula unifasciata]